MPEVSLECLDAIELLLKKDKRERITIFEFLHHPWLQNYKKWKNRKMWANSYSSSSSIASDKEGEETDEDRIEVNDVTVAEVADVQPAGVPAR